MQFRKPSDKSESATHSPARKEIPNLDVPVNLSENTQPRAEGHSKQVSRLSRLPRHAILKICDASGFGDTQTSEKIARGNLCGKNKHKKEAWKSVLNQYYCIFPSAFKAFRRLTSRFPL